MIYFNSLKTSSPPHRSCARIPILNTTYDINNEYERNYYLRMNYKLDNYDIGVYEEINYNELIVETNKTVESTEILE